MRGKRAKLAAFAAKFSFDEWRDRPSMMKYTREDNGTIHCIPMRGKYKAFKKFIKRRAICSGIPKSVKSCGYIIDSRRKRKWFARVNKASSLPLGKAQAPKTPAKKLAEMAKKLPAVFT